jgi:hypothetical protein
MPVSRPVAPLLVALVLVSSACSSSSSNGSAEGSDVLGSYELNGHRLDLVRAPSGAIEGWMELCYEGGAGASCMVRHTTRVSADRIEMSYPPEDAAGATLLPSTKSHVVLKRDASGRLTTATWDPDLPAPGEFPPLSHWEGNVRADTRAPGAQLSDLGVPVWEPVTVTFSEPIEAARAPAPQSPAFTAEPIAMPGSPWIAGYVFRATDWDKPLDVPSFLLADARGNGGSTKAFASGAIITGWGLDAYDANTPGAAPAFQDMSTCDAGARCRSLTNATLRFRMNGGKGHIVLRHRLGITAGSVTSGQVDPEVTIRMVGRGTNAVVEARAKPMTVAPTSEAGYVALSEWRDDLFELPSGYEVGVSIGFSVQPKTATTATPTQANLFQSLRVTD